MNEYKCQCGKHFSSGRSLQSHESQCKFYKEWKLQQQKIQQQEKESRRLPNGMFKCENCGKEHDGSYGSGRFCSEHCRRVWIGKHSAHNGNHKCNFHGKKRRSKYGTWYCNKCNLIFETRAQLTEHNHKEHPIQKGHPWNYGLTKEIDERVAINSQHVSQTLINEYKNGKISHPIWTNEQKKKMSLTCKRNKKSGGYRNRGGKGHRGRYHGYWCDSSWELAYVIYNIEHNIKFSRNTKGFEYQFEGITRKYHPDFLLEDGTYIEIKGWYDQKTLIKHKSFRNLGYKLIVIDKQKIDLYLKYVIQKYGKDFIRLYE